MKDLFSFQQLADNILRNYYLLRLQNCTSLSYSSHQSSLNNQKTSLQLHELHRDENSKNIRRNAFCTSNKTHYYVCRKLFCTPYENVLRLLQISSKVLSLVFHQTNYLQYFLQHRTFQNSASLRVLLVPLGFLGVVLSSSHKQKNLRLLLRNTPAYFQVIPRVLH